MSPSTAVNFRIMNNNKICLISDKILLTSIMIALLFSSLSQSTFFFMTDQQKRNDCEDTIYSSPQVSVTILNSPKPDCHTEGQNFTLCLI